MRKNIAIIGTGISGLTCAHLLHSQHNITVFEANDYIGGHTATKEVEVEGKRYAVDTGFIVYNDWTYPNFIKLMQKLGVRAQATEMSFSVKNKTQNIEYNGNTLNSLFAQRRNILRPRFLRIVRDIVRFNKLCKQYLGEKRDTDGQTLMDFIQTHRLSHDFCYNYILPMCAAIWSTSLAEIKSFPLGFFLRFFNNHGLLNITNRPQWYTIVGGSKQYIAPLIQGFADKIHLNRPVMRVVPVQASDVNSPRRYAVSIKGPSSAEHIEHFDEVIFACHSDKALAMLSQATEQQRSILGSIPYAENEVVLHTDTQVLPKRKLAWASWNYALTGEAGEQEAPAVLTYNMNILQKIESKTTFCVTLNNTKGIAADKILGTYHYSHPQFNHATIAAQGRREEICGQQGLHFCGAYWYNGFHEDGVRSALDVCARFGAAL
jgi:uncharacterized protein